MAAEPRGRAGNQYRPRTLLGKENFQTPAIFPKLVYKAQGKAPGLLKEKAHALNGRDFGMMKHATPVDRSEWRIVPLLVLCCQDRRMIVPRSDQARALRYLGLENVVAESGEIIPSPVTDEDAGKSTTFAFDVRHVLYGKLRPYLNKVALPDSPGRCTTEIIPLLPRKGCDREYLAYSLRRAETVEVAMRGVTGSRMPRANLDELFRMEVPLPPLAEQRRLASLLREQLSAVAEARAALQAQLQAAAALPSALLREVFENGEASAWPSVLISEVAEVRGGIQKTPDRAPRNFHRPFLTVRNVQHGYLNLDNVEQFEITPMELERSKLETGDLLIVEGNGSLDHIGRSAMFDQAGEWVHQNHIIRVRLAADRAFPAFVSRFFASPRGRTKMIEKAMTTTGLHTLSTSKVSALSIPLPPLATQRLLAARLDKSFAEVAALRAGVESRLAAVERLPAALLREVFGSRSRTARRMERFCFHSGNSTAKERGIISRPSATPHPAFATP